MKHLILGLCLVLSGCASIEERCDWIQSCIDREYGYRQNMNNAMMGAIIQQHSQPLPAPRYYQNPFPRQYRCTSTRMLGELYVQCQ